MLSCCLSDKKDLPDAILKKSDSIPSLISLNHSQPFSVFDPLKGNSNDFLHIKVFSLHGLGRIAAYVERERETEGWGTENKRKKKRCIKPFVAPEGVDKLEGWKCLIRKWRNEELRELERNELGGPL